MLYQNRVVDGDEGFLSGEAHGEDAEVALHRQARASVREPS